MADSTGPAGPTITVRYWAAARAAAGQELDEVPAPGPTTLDAVLAEVGRRHAGAPKFADVLGCCSVLVGDRPVAGLDPATVPLVPGDRVELLPPFAGG